MRDWLPERPQYVDILLELEAPIPTRPCYKCLAPGSMWRCEDCQGSPLYCDTCISEVHRCTPFHRVLKWQGTHFEPAALHQTGLTLYLGHHGKPCPCSAPHLQDPGQTSDQSQPEFAGVYSEDNANPEEAGDQEAYQSASGGIPMEGYRPPVGNNPEGYPWLIFVDTTGVHYLPVCFCECRSPRARHIQLLEAGLYPATVKKPRTAFTFQVLDDFYLDNLECKTPARNFYQKLRRKTSNLFPHLVPVSLMTCQEKKTLIAFKGPISRASSAFTSVE